MPFSMTGFARQSVQDIWGELSCEIRSVNHRYLETNLRLPETLRALEPELRELLRSVLKRGKIDVNFQLNANESNTSLEVNHSQLQALHQALQTVKHVIPTATPSSTLEILQWPGVLTAQEQTKDIIHQKAGALFQQTLNALCEHRKREGNALEQLIATRLFDINEQIEIIRSEFPAILQQHKAKLLQRIGEWQIELDETRLEQECVLLANKSDIAEELDRLKTHITEVQHILKQQGAIGRKLDFMMQELNREANTLSSKSLSSTTTQASVEIKVLIEQMREQIQNIE